MSDWPTIPFARHVARNAAPGVSPREISQVALEFVSVEWSNCNEAVPVSYWEVVRDTVAPAIGMK